MNRQRKLPSKVFKNRITDDVWSGPVHPLHCYEAFDIRVFFFFLSFEVMKAFRLIQYISVQIHCSKVELNIKFNIDVMDFLLLHFVYLTISHSSKNDIVFFHAWLFDRGIDILPCTKPKIIIMVRLIQKFAILIYQTYNHPSASTTT